MKKVILLILVAILILGAVFSYYAYRSIYQDNIVDVGKRHVLVILPGSTYEQLKTQLETENIIIDVKSFDLTAKLMGYKGQKIPTGRYILENEWSNRELISKLRAGRQDAVNLTFNNVRELKDLAGKLSENILLDSITILSFFEQESNYKELGLTRDNLMTLFIPNTYKVYWDIEMSDLLKRMSKEHSKFWNTDRQSKANDLGLTISEVYTLASIVDKESLVREEKPRIAGLYLNRLQRGILLQADPTVVFALKQFDLRRVLNKHLEYEHPYNTYLNLGLPPGPIYMSSISGIDAVLNYEDHDFIYMCAKPDGNGMHAFAKTLAGHNKNANRYRAWLNRRGIR